MEQVVGRAYRGPPEQCRNCRAVSYFLPKHKCCGMCADRLVNEYFVLKEAMKEKEERIRALEKEVVELKARPGGEIYLEAREHFESLR